MNEATQVGLKNLYFALETSDTLTGATYAVPVSIAPAINAKMTPKSSSTVLYADNGAAESATAVGEIGIELETKNIPLAIQAILLGHTLSGGVMIRKSTDVAPYVAIGFEALKSNNTKRYRWIFKVRFEVPAEDFKTKGDKVDFQTAKIKGTGVMRAYDGAYDKIADEEDPGYLPATGAAWYTTVQGAADTTPPTVTIVPANAAAAVAVGTTVTWTFNKAIQDVCVSAANFALVADAAGTTIAGALALDATKKIVTFTPTANLTAATPYRAIATVGVKDLSGNALATNSVTKFTTA